MSVLTFILLWVGGSCAATPLIGAFLGTLDRSPGLRVNPHFAEFRPRSNKGRIIDRDDLSEGLPLISQFPRRRPAADFALRTSRRVRR